MANNDLCFKIAGEAGQGINVSALILARVFTRKGYNAFLLTENPNSIKLEHAWCSLRISPDHFFSQAHQIDILIALNGDSIAKHHREVVKGGYVFYDAESIKLEKEDRLEDIEYISMPLARLTKENNLPELLRNTVSIGVILAMIGHDLKAAEDLLLEIFNRKAEDIVRQNLDALKAGFDYIKKNNFTCKICNLKEAQDPPKMFLTGNEAICVGAIKAGCKFLSAYPMTPSSSILHYMAQKEKECNIVVKHTEDEIAAINMAIGANFTGVRAMTCTSGGGFSLMTEALGLAAQSETPLVVVVGERPGPSTGQPTHTSQGDLRFLLHASQGEFLRIMIAPGDLEECFKETFNAFNLSEKFQVPVIILTDKYLAESYSTIREFEHNNLNIDRGKLLTQGQLDKMSDYKRYAFSENGISARSIPSQRNGIHLATSYEHDEYGYYEEAPDGVAKMIDKRFAKLDLINNSLLAPCLYGLSDADITLIAWGSSKNPILEAMDMLKKDNIRVNFLHILYVWPFPAKKVSEVIRGSKITLGIEGNKTGQMMGIIKQETGLDVNNQFLKYNGQPFYPIEIYDKVREILKR